MNCPICGTPQNTEYIILDNIKLPLLICPRCSADPPDDELVDFWANQCPDCGASEPAHTPNCLRVS